MTEVIGNIVVYNGDKNEYSVGLTSGEIAAVGMRPIVKDILCRLSEYENTQLAPCQIVKLRAENDLLRAGAGRVEEFKEKEEIEWDESESKVVKSGSEPMHYVYTHKITGEKYRLGDLQNKYGLGFADSELWKIIERDYEGESRPQKEWTRL